MNKKTYLKPNTYSIEAQCTMPITLSQPTQNPGVVDDGTTILDAKPYQPSDNNWED